MDKFRDELVKLCKDAGLKSMPSLRTLPDDADQAEILEVLRQTLDELAGDIRVLTEDKERWRDQCRELRKEVEAAYQSNEYCLGRAILDILRNPLIGIKQLPLRIFRGGRRLLRKTGIFKQKKNARNRFVKHAHQGQALTLESPHQTGSILEWKTYAPRSSVFREVQTDNFIDSWSCWQSYGVASLKQQGDFILHAAKQKGGLKASGILLNGSTYCRITVRGNLDKASLTILAVAGDENQSGEIKPKPLNTPLDFRGNTVSQVFYLPQRVQSIDVQLEFNASIANTYLKIDSITIESARPGELDLRPRLEYGHKLIASLATIPDREEFMCDAVFSILPQVDEVRVYLNGYTDTPKCFCNHPQVTCVNSRDWIDNGDAGKFYWCEDSTPGYRFICDDDLLYPSDYAEHMIACLKDNKNAVIIGLHGILLKQPINDYYAKTHRYVRGYSACNNFDFAVHLLGTGAVAYAQGTIDLRRDDFLYPNMADVWLAKQAQRQQIPLICVERPANWVKTRPDEVIETIHAHSTSSANDMMNTGEVQSAVLQQLYPVTIKQPATLSAKRKIILSIKTYNRLAYLAECLQSFVATHSPAYEWVVIIADDGSEDGTREYLDSVEVPFEMHVIENERRYAGGQTNTIFQLAQKIGFDFGFCVDDDLVFMKPGWEKLYIEAIQKSGFDHLCYFDRDYFIGMQKQRDPEFKIDSPTQDPSQMCEAHISVDSALGALFTFTPRMLSVLGGCDEENFPVRGQWHIDLSTRACRAGFNEARHFYDAKGSGAYLTLQNNKQGENYVGAIPAGETYQSTLKPDELARRRQVIADTSRMYVPIPYKPTPLKKSPDNKVVNLVNASDIQQVVKEHVLHAIRNQQDYLELHLGWRTESSKTDCAQDPEKIQIHCQQKTDEPPKLISISAFKELFPCLLAACLRAEEGGLVNSLCVFSDKVEVTWEEI